jgi:hypothetical protein
MGAWDAGSFENDAALGWVHTVCQNGHADPVRTALCRVLEQSQPTSHTFLEKILGRIPPEPHLTADAACEALAAAEIVAFWLGRPTAHFPTYLADWARLHADALSPELTAYALEAVATIMIQSELKDLWEEGDSVIEREWHEAMADLERRLDQTGA